MNMPEEFTVPQAASFLGVSEETVRRNIRSKPLESPASGYSVVHSPRCARDIRQQLRSQDWPNTSVGISQIESSHAS